MIAEWEAAATYYECWELPSTEDFELVEHLPPGFARIDQMQYVSPLEGDCWQDAIMEAQALVIEKHRHYMGYQFDVDGFH